MEKLLTEKGSVGKVAEQNDVEWLVRQMRKSYSLHVVCLCLGHIQWRKIAIVVTDNSSPRLTSDIRHAFQAYLPP